MMLEENLIKVDRLLSEIEHTYNLRWWNYATCSAPLETADLDEERRKIYYDDSLFEALKKEAIEKENVKSRKIKLYLRQFYINRVELDKDLSKLKNEVIEDELSSVSTINGKKYTIKELLAITQNSLELNIRNQVIKRLEELNKQKEEKFMEVIRLRNVLSKELGFKNYIGIYFYALEPDISEFVNFTKRTIIYYSEKAKDFESWLKSSAKSDDDTNSAIKKIQEELGAYYNVLNTEETFIDILKIWGLEYLLNSVKIFNSGDLPNKKHWWTFCQPISIPYDIRISINKLNSIEFVEALYHELGHAIHYASIEQNDWIFKKEDLFTEIPAAFMVNICSEDEWIERFLNIKNASIKEKIKRVSISRDPTVILSRSLDFLLMLRLYEGEENPNKVFSDLYKRIFGYRGQNCSSSKKWNFEILFVEEPFYGLFHLIGEIFGRKILDFLLNDYGSIFQKSVGEIIANKLFKPGNSVSWFKRVESISNKISPLR